MKTKRAKLTARPCHTDPDSPFIVEEFGIFYKYPQKEITFERPGDLPAAAAAFARDAAAEVDAARRDCGRAPAGRRHGVHVTVRCLEARKPPGFDKATRNLYFFDDETIAQREAKKAEAPEAAAAPAAEADADAAPEAPEAPQNPTIDDPSLRVPTPWGQSDGGYRFRDLPGVVEVSTPSHGGFRLDETAAAAMHPALRDVGAEEYGYLWFEEDCACIAVYLAFPQLWKHNPKISEDYLRAQLARWYPAQFEAFASRPLQPGESPVRDREAWDRENAGKWAVYSACATGFADAGDAPMPDLSGHNLVACIAHPVRAEGGHGTETRYFYVDRDRYRARGDFSYLIAEGDREHFPAPAQPADESDESPAEAVRRKMAEAQLAAA